MSNKKNVFNARKNKRGQSSKGVNSDNIWDDLEKVYLECCAVSTTPATVLPLIKNAELVDKVEDRQELTESTAILTRDAKDYAQRLNEIHEKHRNYSGKADTAEEMMLAYSLGEEYQNWLVSYQTVVLPTTNKILAMFEYAKSGSEEEISE
jgi:hypothetical protein